MLSLDVSIYHIAKTTSIVVTGIGLQHSTKLSLTNGW